MKLYSDEQLAAILDQPIFHLIGDCADELGVECYVVGGYVRDIFLERPSKDIDVVVVGSGIEVARRLKEKLGRKAHLSVFKNFGTAQVVVREQLIVKSEQLMIRPAVNDEMQKENKNYSLSTVHFSQHMPRSSL